MAKEQAEQEQDGLTRLELQIMQVIWQSGPGSVSDVQARLEQRLAYTTVQTMLNILERKGKLKRKLRGRAFQYSATVSKATASRHAVRDLVDRMFGGSSEDLVMSLIKDREIDPKKIAKLGKRLRKEGEAE